MPILPLGNCLCSCQKENKIEERDKIIFPANLSSTKVLDSNHETYTTLIGFTFTGSLEFNRLQIFESFNISKGVIQSSIVDWNSFTKSFSVQIYTKNVDAGSYTGTIEFKYDGLPIETEQSANIELTLINQQTISQPDNTTDEKQLDSDGNAEFKFTNFKCVGLEDVTKLHVTSEFQLKDATFTTRLEVVNDDTFNVYVKVQNGKPRILSSHLLFDYDGIPLINVPTNEFVINLLEPTLIIEPSIKSQSVISNIYQQAIITFKNFSYSGLDPKTLDVETTFQLDCDSFSCKVINIDEFAHVFDVQIIANGVKHYEGDGKFTFLWDAHSWQTSTFHIKIETSIPLSYLNISPDSDGLISFNGFNSTDFGEYDTLLIPNFVQAIGEEACSGGIFLKLDFEENSSLEIIREGGFAECNFIETVTIPSSVRTISSAAFYATGLKSVTFEDGVNSLSIEDSAFLNSQDLNGRIQLPQRIEFVGKRAFDGTHVDELYIPSTLKEVQSESFIGLPFLKAIYLNDESEQLPSWMTTYSGDNNVFGGAGDGVQEPKFVYLPNSPEIDIEEAQNILFNKMGLPSDIGWEIVKK